MAKGYKMAGWSLLEIGDRVIAKLYPQEPFLQYEITDILAIQSARTESLHFAYVLDGGKATVPLRFIRYRIDESGRAVRLDDEKTECKEVKL